MTSEQFATELTTLEDGTPWITWDTLGQKCAVGISTCEEKFLMRAFCIIMKIRYPRYGEHSCTTSYNLSINQDPSHHIEWKRLCSPTQVSLIRRVFGISRYQPIADQSWFCHQSITATLCDVGYVHTSNPTLIFIPTLSPSVESYESSLAINVHITDINPRNSIFQEKVNVLFWIVE